MAVLALSATNRAFADLARTISTLYVPHGRYVILGCILGASGWNVYTARWNAYQLGAIGCALFLVLTPGFGVQYLIYVCPLLFAVSLGWAIGYATLAGVFAGLVYYSFWDHTVPVRSWLNTDVPMPVALVGLLVWMLLIAVLLQHLGRAEGRADPRSAGAAATGVDGAAAKVRDGQPGRCSGDWHGSAARNRPPGLPPDGDASGSGGDR